MNGCSTIPRRLRLRIRLHQKYLLRARRSQRGALENSLVAHWCFGWCFELGRVWVVGARRLSAQLPFNPCGDPCLLIDKLIAHGKQSLEVGLTAHHKSGDAHSNTNGPRYPWFGDWRIVHNDNARPGCPRVGYPTAELPLEVWNRTTMFTMASFLDEKSTGRLPMSISLHRTAVQ